MVDVLVTQTLERWEFRRDFTRGRIVLSGNEGVFNRVQLRAVASLLGVPPGETVEFLDSGTFETLAVVQSQPLQPQ